MSWPSGKWTLLNHMTSREACIKSLVWEKRGKESCKEKILKPQLDDKFHCKWDIEIITQHSEKNYKFFTDLSTRHKHALKIRWGYKGSI